MHVEIGIHTFNILSCHCRLCSFFLQETHSPEEWRGICTLNSGFDKYYFKVYPVNK